MLNRKQGVFLCVKSATERQSQRRDWFFTLSAQFPLYFLPEDPCLQNVQSMLSMDRRLWNLPEQKNMKRERARERERGRNEEMLLLPPTLQHRKMELLPRKPHRLVFSLSFLSRSSRNTELLLRPEYLDRTPVTHSDVEGEEEKTNAPRSKVHQPLILSCITPNWCSCETANGRLGVRFDCG